MLQIFKCIVLAVRRGHCSLHFFIILPSEFILKVSFDGPSPDCWVSDLLHVPQVGSSLEKCYCRQNFLYIMTPCEFSSNHKALEEVLPGFFHQPLTRLRQLGRMGVPPDS